MYIYNIYSNTVYPNFSALEKVRLLSTFASILIGKMLIYKPQFCSVNISINKTIIFDNMLNSL